MTAEYSDEKTWFISSSVIQAVIQAEVCVGK